VQLHGGEELNGGEELIASSSNELLLHTPALCIGGRHRLPHRAHPLRMDSIRRRHHRRRPGVVLGASTPCHMTHDAVCECGVRRIILHLCRPRAHAVAARCGVRQGERRQRGRRGLFSSRGRKRRRGYTARSEWNALPPPAPPAPPPTDRWARVSMISPPESTRTQHVTWAAPCRPRPEPRAAMVAPERTCHTPRCTP
jgi:hypothetical protein